MNNYANLFSDAAVPQSQPLNDRQVPNNAGGFVFAVDKWKRLERFLILGSDSNTFYQKAQALTRENGKLVEECWTENAALTAGLICGISGGGRAPKNDAAIFALALGVINEDVNARQWALESVKIVCRTGTHLFQFVALAKQLGRGFGRGMKRAVAEWYNSRDVDRLGYQMVKYRNRERLTHENLIDLCHVRTTDPVRNRLYRWGIGKDPHGELPAVVSAHNQAIKLTPEDKAQLLDIVRTVKGLPWEALPTWANSDPDIQGALLPGMGLTAIVRNLANFTRIGLIAPMSVAEDLIVNRLTVSDDVRRSKIHPLQILVALKIYAAGRSISHGGKETTTWAPSQRIINALNAAFYTAFQNVVPTGKRHFISIDVSGSMSTAISGSPHVSCCEAASALAMVVAKTEDRSYVTRFNNGLERIDFSHLSRLDDVLRFTRSINTGGTDCSLPMIVAAAENIPVDVFVVLTDNETHHGRMHPMAALREYRKKTGIPAKLIVVAMTPTKFTIADPQDAGSLDIVGFDAGMPEVIANFVRD